MKEGAPGWHRNGGRVISQCTSSGCWPILRVGRRRALLVASGLGPDTTYEWSAVASRNTTDRSSNDVLRDRTVWSCNSVWRWSCSDVPELSQHDPPAQRV